MIISHSEEAHKPVHLTMIQKEYSQADLQIDFKASAMNNARWSCTYHNHIELWLATDDPEAIRFAKELEEYLGTDTAKCLIDDEVHNYSISCDEDDYLRIKVYCDTYSEFNYSDPYDHEIDIEVV